MANQLAVEFEGRGRLADQGQSSGLKSLDRVRWDFSLGEQREGAARQREPPGARENADVQQAIAKIGGWEYVVMATVKPAVANQYQLASRRVPSAGSSDHIAKPPPARRNPRRVMPAQWTIG